MGGGVLGTLAEVSGAAHALHVADCFDYLNEATPRPRRRDRPPLDGVVVRLAAMA